MGVLPGVLSAILKWTQTCAVNRKGLGASSIWGCAGLNRHVVEDERASRERSSDPFGPEFCTGHCEVLSEA